VLLFSALVGREVLFSTPEDDLQRGKVACCAVGWIEPVSEGGREVVAI
jgi:hypothetical protein